MECTARQNNESQEHGTTSLQGAGGRRWAWEPVEPQPEGTRDRSLSDKDVTPGGRGQRPRCRYVHTRD